ncbi:hypothetical protein [Ketobacter sp.]|uniref:hypothetical protein n=1 Tax=Ketobacter sp. TaxID=2083498 RepID=UPI000F0E7D2B|nr:hypothetical protein [Ketobacter sp.]RLU01134.1 MAG: hypothetical protein D9N14_04085 [Ketobacter sp.]
MSLAAGAGVATRHRDGIAQRGLFVAMIGLVAAAFGVWLPQLSTFLSNQLLESLQWLQAWALYSNLWDMLNDYIALLVHGLALVLLLATISIFIVWYERASGSG